MHPDQTPWNWPPPYQPPKPKRRWGLWIGLGSAVLALVCLAGAAVAVITLPSLIREPVARGSRSPGPARSPVDGDPEPVRIAWVRERIQEALAQQGQALIAGDEAGYLAIAGPALSTQERGGLVRQFRSLRAMNVTGWRDRVDIPVGRSNDTWAVDVFGTGCFIVATCADGDAPATMVWEIKQGRALLSSWTPGTESHPWQTDELVAKVGSRTVVATTKALAGELTALSAEAEKAALVADRFAQNGKPPAQYVAYLAGEKEWSRWFDSDPVDWAAGIAIEVSTDRYDVMINADVGPSGYAEILRHELTHASSLPGGLLGGKEVWWLIEGIAELAEADGAPASQHRSLDEVRKLLRSGEVTGIDLSPPGANDSEDEASGRYGMAYLGLRCMAERYGEAKVVLLFHAVVHEKLQIAGVVTRELNEDWSVLGRECFEYAKQTAG